MNKVQKFAQELIAAGNSTKDGIPWRPFLKNEDVATELKNLGYELVAEGASFNPRLVRFFAMRKS